MYIIYIVPPTVVDHDELNKVFIYFRIILDYYDFLEEKYELSCKKEVEMAIKLKSLFIHRNVVVPDSADVLVLLNRIFAKVEEAYRT